MPPALTLPDARPEPVTDPPPPPPEPRRPVSSRRWRRFGGGVLAAVSVSTLVWWHAAVTAGPGLAFTGGGNVFRSTPGDRTGITETWNTLGVESKVEFLPGGTFMAFFDLHNGGPRSLRIEELRPQSFHYWGFEGVALSGGEHDAFADPDAVPFEPFTLAPGESRPVRLDFRLADCNPAGLQDGYSVVKSLPVTYKVLGFRRTVDVPFDMAALSVHAFGKCDLPLLPWR